MKNQCNSLNWCNFVRKDGTSVLNRVASLWNVDTFSFLKLRKFLLNCNQRHIWGLKWPLRISDSLFYHFTGDLEHWMARIEWRKFKKFQGFEWFFLKEIVRELVAKRKISIFKTRRLERTMMNHVYDEKNFPTFSEMFEFLQFSGVPSAARKRLWKTLWRTWNNQSENFLL